MATKKPADAPPSLIGLKYKGQHGAHLNGIPARDLSKAEVTALSEAQVEACLQSKLYEVDDES